MVTVRNRKPSSVVTKTEPAVLADDVLSHPRTRCLPADVQRRLEWRTRQAQRAYRAPAMSVALHRADRTDWSCTVGTTGRAGTPLTADTQFGIGSGTKTFTAVLVMQCRDDGLLDLDDPIGRFLEMPALGEATIRRILAHSSGLQREPHGDAFDLCRWPELPEFLADLTHAELVVPAGQRFHYSNLAVALLGHVVARLRGGSWQEVVQDRILSPLALKNTTTHPADTSAIGFMVDAYSDHVRPEPLPEFGAIAPAAALWSTAGDMARWAGFLADPQAVDPTQSVLAPQTLAEMRLPLTVTDETTWSTSFGLGLKLIPQKDGPGAESAVAGAGSSRGVLHVGLDGAMPGYFVSAYGRVGGTGTPRAMSCAVLATNRSERGLARLAHELITTTVQWDPADPAPWVPGDPPPADYRSALGNWWSEGLEYVFSWRHGALRARYAAEGPASEAVFELERGERDVFRTVGGRRSGEVLRLIRNDQDEVTSMKWVGLSYTRDQRASGGVSTSLPTGDPFPE